MSADSPMNPWIVDPVWTAFSSFHCEMRHAEETRNEFMVNHHRASAFYFAITTVEAQMNHTIRKAGIQGGKATDQIEAEIRGPRFEDKLKSYKELVEAGGATVQQRTRALLAAVNKIRNEVTHRKDRGFKTFIALEQINLQELRMGVVEVCIAAHQATKKPYPYWLTGWNFVQRKQPDAICPSLAPTDVRFPLRQMGFSGLPSSDNLGHLFKAKYLQGLDGYRELIAFLDQVGRCQPYDAQFPQTPVFCRRWWDWDHVASGCPDEVPGSRESHNTPVHYTPKTDFKVKMPPPGAQPDPRNQGWYLGWAVRRENPWHLAGFFGSKSEAEAKQRKLGKGYSVEYGSHRLGSDDFVCGDSTVRV